MIAGPEQSKEMQQLREFLSKARLHQTVTEGTDSISVLVKVDDTRAVSNAVLIQFKGYRQTVWLHPYYFKGDALNPLGSLLVALCTLPMYCPTIAELQAYLDYLNIWLNFPIKDEVKPELIQRLAGTLYPDELHLRQSITQYLTTLTKPN